MNKQRVLIVLLGISIAVAVGHSGIRSTTNQSTSSQLPTDSTASPVFTLEDVHPLTSSREVFLYPLWSPTGHRLAFTKGTSLGIYVFDFTTNTRTQVTEEGTTAFGTMWTTDGQHLVYEHFLDPYRVHWLLRTVNVLTKTSIDISAPLSDVSAATEIHSGVVVVRDKRNHSNQRVVFSTTTDSLPDAPFVFEEGNRIYATIHGATKQVSSGTQSYLLPVLSPDGNKVVYESLSPRFYVTDLDSSETMSLLGSDPSWSPDSQYVLFEVTEDGSSDILGADLYIADMKGRTIRLTNTPDRLEMHARWSPDGQYIAFESRGVIYIGRVVKQ